MEEALEMARAKDTKERMAGVERLHQLLEASRKSLSSLEVTSLVDCCLDLLKDNNFRVSQGDSDVTEKPVDPIKVYSERYAVVPDDNVKRINFAEGKI
ncbi:CLIP-associated protein-like isoform X1 [Camellia sinensis]|uniref:CLIP-associated protein-like isoform X1 n=1 Tax=Camellia sinensis TaxID=4442 RepID=UPI00103598B8|nr:CLIP-associated protein-like isoform X1 [Camellia sinensis]